MHPDQHALSSDRKHGGETTPQRQFDVHLFPVVRLQVSSVQAATHREAIDAALAKLNLYEQFSGTDCEFAEELSHSLVDVVGDQEYQQSRWFYSRQTPLMANLLRLVEWHEGGRSEQELEQLIQDCRDIVASSH